MRRFFSGRVKAVRLPQSMALPSLSGMLGMLGNTGRALLGPGSPGKSIKSALAAVDDRSACFAAIEKLVRELVGNEVRALAPVRDDGSFGGAAVVRRRAQTLSDFGGDEGAAWRAWGDSVATLVRDMCTAVEVPMIYGDALRVSVPLIGMVRDPAKLIKTIVATALSWSSERGELQVGGAVAKKLKENLLAISGLSEEDARRRPQRLTWPSLARGGTASELAERYLGGTPFADFFLAKVELGIEDKDLVESAWIMARIGHGKTQLLEHLVVQLLNRKHPPSIVAIDSQGEMLERLARLKLFAPGQRLQDWPVWIDPREMERPVALNPFAQRRDRLAQYPPAMREQLENGVIALLEYLFGAVLGAELTQRQGMIFRYLARLMLVIPNATLVTLRDVVQTPEPYMHLIAQLPDDDQAKQFFEQQFFAKDYVQTRQQIARRLWGVLEQRTFQRMMSAPENKLDLFEKLQDGCAVFIDTAKAFLDTERSAILGRLAIALTVRAIFERAAVPREDRRPTFLIIDEAAEVLDSKILELISQGRKYRAGTIVAHQLIEGQLTRPVRASLATNTNVKLIGGVSDGDARDLAADLGTSAAFLFAAERHAKSSEFSLHVKGKTRSAVRITVPFGSLDREPRMSDGEWEAVKQRSRELYGASPVPGTRPTIKTPKRSRPKPGPEPEDEIDWRS